VKSHVDTTPRGEPARIIPAESVLAGGDDLISVVPAHTALQVAAYFISVFRQRTKEFQRAWVERGNLCLPLCSCGADYLCGSGTGHAFYPANQLTDLAGGLLKFAKRKAADLAKKKRIEGSITFHGASLPR
jgi:hypothetical protein